MNRFERGTDEFALALGLVFAGCGALVLWIGFWKTLLLAVLFIIGYLIGGKKDLGILAKNAVDKIVPQKSEETVNFRAEIEKRQTESMGKIQNEKTTSDSREG